MNTRNQHHDRFLFCRLCGVQPTNGQNGPQSESFLRIKANFFTDCLSSFLKLKILPNATRIVPFKVITLCDPRQIIFKQADLLSSASLAFGTLNSRLFK